MYDRSSEEGTKCGQSGSHRKQRENLQRRENKTAFDEEDRTRGKLGGKWTNTLCRLSNNQPHSKEELNATSDRVALIGDTNLVG